jgi:mono/diheme cytochrome c family protein
MKLFTISTTFLLMVLFISCGGKEEKKDDGFSLDRQKTSTTQTQESPPSNAVNASERIALDNKGVGPVKSVTLAPEPDQALAAQGKEIYDQMCLACHRVGKRFIGPAPNGVLERRSPEWVMNMILNPEVMVKEDPLAKDLLIEFNGSPMANQGLNEDQARAVLEYFRTLE